MYYVKNLKNITFDANKQKNVLHLYYSFLNVKRILLQNLNIFKQSLMFVHLHVGLDLQFI